MSFITGNKRQTMKIRSFPSVFVAIKSQFISFSHLSVSVIQFHGTNNSVTNKLETFFHQSEHNLLLTSFYSQLPIDGRISSLLLALNSPF